MSSDTQRYSLSPMQEGMLYHHISSPRSGVDIEQIAARLGEALDLEAFRRAWQAVGQRHDQFRTRFRWEGVERPVQEVLPAVDLAVAQEDWRDRSPEEQDRLFTRLLDTERRRGFDFSAAPLSRVVVARRGADSYAFLWTFHHILFDGRSFPIVLNDLFRFYDEYRQGREPQVERARSFSEYVQWFEEQDFGPARAYWKRLLEGFDSPTPLPGSRLDDRSNAQDEDVKDEREFVLDRDITRRLKERAKEEGYTLNTIVNGAWALLLARYSGESDIVFGATRACRHSCVEGALDMAGTFINTLPVRVAVEGGEDLTSWLRSLRQQLVAAREHEQAPLVQIIADSDVPAGTPLFESLIVFDSARLETTMSAQGGEWSRRHFRLHEKTGYPLTLYGYGEDELVFRLAHSRARIDEETAERLIGHFLAILESIASSPARTVGAISMLTSEERQRILKDWNATERDYPRDLCVQQLFEERARRAPDRVALLFRGEKLDYGELNARANRVAHRLRALGVGTETLVGVALERSVEMVVGILGVLKAGGAYVPLDPEYPHERLDFMIADSGAKVLLTQKSVLSRLRCRVESVLCVDRDADAIAEEPADDPPLVNRSDNLAYVIYTSGSTGKPKGTMVEHRQVMNFFVGMDERIGTEPGVWLAVTSLSFDISVLELLWTLTRGFEVVLFSDPARAAAVSGLRPRQSGRAIDFSLFYFASDEAEKTSDKYRLLLDGARFADENGFLAVSIPERHFHAFGGLYPNPSVAAAAVASITRHVQIRAGSCVLPLHDPIRIAEEWSLVDNLSVGRVGIAFASGWQPNDFVLAPENYENRKKLLSEGIETVRRLWRGEAVKRTNPLGQEVEIRTLPRPVQPELPVWVTTAGNVETYREAGRLGANVLTHLLGQTVEELKEKIDAYREAYRQSGYPGSGHVTLMLHTFVGPDLDRVKELAREPMKSYLASAISLVRGFTSSWTAFRQSKGTAKTNVDVDLDSLSPEEMDSLLEFSFERYFEMSGLFGTPAMALEQVERIEKTGVDEIACLIDFGIDSEHVLESLPYLAEVRHAAVADPTDPTEYTISRCIEEHEVTHLQCTPSMGTLLVQDPDTRRALARVQTIMIGGEAFPPALAQQLRESTSGRILNMYGPTETTIWSSTEEVRDEGGSIPLGRPIANTTFYVLDTAGQPVPVGVPGELYIGGEGVVRGYHQRPELTADRFVPDPFGPDGSRLYRTGDLVRYRADGNLEFLGRLDHQVKLRGYRIELGEIESAIRECAGVRESVVVAREDTPGDQRLVAYLVARENETVSTDEIRDHLRELLPEYMVPSKLMELDSLPLTPNRKVDRKALPAPETRRAPEKTAYEAPASEVERTLAEIWQEVLGLEKVGANDNFFDLGGHSLLTVRIQSIIGDRLSRKVPITDLFRFPTLRSLSTHLAGAGSGETTRKGSDRAAARRQARGLARRRRS